MPTDQASHDNEAITHVVTEYFQSWFVGDPERMRAALHPALAKRSADPTGADQLALDENDAESMVEIARVSHRDPSEHWQEVTILDVHEDIATVMVRSAAFVEYLHLGRFGDRWLIVNAFYLTLD